jgi:hypothetical protein
VALALGGGAYGWEARLYDVAPVLAVIQDGRGAPPCYRLVTTEQELTAAVEAEMLENVNCEGLR